MSADALGFGTPAKVIQVPAALIALPHPEMLNDRAAIYQLNVAPFTRYVSNGSSLAPITLFAQQKNTILAIGDSNTANGVSIGANPSYQQNSALNWGLALLKQQLWLPFGVSNSWVSGAADIVNYNLAVSGIGTVSALANQVPSAIALGAGWWSVQIGTNDFILAANVPDSVATICGRIRQIVQAGLGAGANVALWTLPPRSDAAGAGNWQSFSATITGAGSTVANQRLKHMAVNQWIRRYARETSGVVLIDPFAELVDPASATGDWKSGYNTDGVHWNNAGAFIAGQVFARAVSPFIKQVNDTSIDLIDVYDATYNVAGNQMLGAQNAGLQGAGGAVSGVGISGTPPTGWTVELESGTLTPGTLVNTTQARTDTFLGGLTSNGRELLMTVAGAVPGAAVVRAYQAILANAIPAGSLIYGEVELSVSSNGGAWQGPELFLNLSTGSPNALARAFPPDGSSLPVGGTFDCVLRTPIVRSTVGNRGFLITRMNLIASSAAAMKIRRIAIRVLDPALPGLILGSA